MKKATQILFLLVFTISAAFAQQRDMNARSSAPVEPMVTGASSILVTSLYESFEGGVFPPTGWAKYSPDGGTGWEQMSVGTSPLPGWNGGVCTPAPTGNGGISMAYCTWSTGGASSNDQWLVTPQITIQGGYTLTFWTRKFSDLYLDLMSIKVSTTTNQTSAFTQEPLTISWAATDTGWSSHSVDLSPWAGQNIYIAFHEHVADNINDGAAIFVELVRVDMGTGIGENHAQEFKLYPNPAKDVMTLESASNISHVRISNILGTLVEDRIVEGNKVKINTNGFEPGVYFVTVETSTGKVVRKINVTR